MVDREAHVILERDGVIGESTRWLVLLGALGVPGLAAQSRSVPDSVTVTPFVEFQASGFRRFLLGTNYRELWIRPIRVAEADLGTIGRGLQAIARNGANESRPFQFKAADGRTYGFRSLVKDATLDWPERLRTNTLRKLAREQISGTVPAGALVVARIDKAAGVLEPGLELVVLPDDPGLGQWRPQFARALGTLEPRLRDSERWLGSVPGAREFASTDELFKRLRGDPQSRVVRGIAADW